MQKKLNRKLVLNKETLRTLTQQALGHVNGGGTRTTEDSDASASCMGCRVTGMERCTDTSL
jgi:hypothetical protein